MVTCKWLAAFLLGSLSLPVVAQAEAHCPGNVASVRLRLVERSQIIIPVRVNHGGPYEFLVDTGAQVTSVDAALAREAHLTIQGTTGVVGVDFHARPPFAYINLLEAGSSSAGNVLAVIQQSAHLSAAAPHIRGVLGGDFLRHFDVLIDHAHNLLCLDDMKTMRQSVKGERLPLLTPPQVQDGSLFTEPLITAVHLPALTDRPILLLLDSGANVPFLYEVDRHSAHPSFAALTLRSRGADGGEMVFSVLAPQDMSIGRTVLHQVSFVTPDGDGKRIQKVGVDGLLPTGLFRRVYISYADRFLVLEPW